MKTRKALLLLIAVLLIFTAGCGKEEVKPAFDGNDANEPVVFDYATEDVNGNSVFTLDIFSENEYTMVNVWASWCGPCIGELEDIQKLSEEYSSQGIGIIGLLSDGTDPEGLADAKEIMNSKNILYTNIIMTDEMDRVLRISVVPTTFFVDRNGQIVGDKIYGAYIDQYRDVLDELLGK